jgi:hypothetical protein
MLAISRATHRPMQQIVHVALRLFLNELKGERRG